MSVWLWGVLACSSPPSDLGTTATNSGPPSSVTETVTGSTVDTGIVPSTPQDTGTTGPVDTGTAPHIDTGQLPFSTPYDTAVSTSTTAPVEERVLSELKAFPSAVGAGAATSGGRGGVVLHVTNLDDSGEGSLREALMAEGPRTIVFDVSGEIALASRIELVDENSDFTLAGQTAPEGGITVSGFPILLAGGYDRESTPTDNVILRHLRLRNGSYTGEPDVYDHNGIISGGTDGFVLDHLSFSFNDDQAISFSGWFGPVQNGTIQRCLFSENATGIILGHESEHINQDISTNHNLFVHQSHRTPNVGGDGRFDVINNVAFNWEARLTNAATRSPQLNYIGNHLTPGAYSGDANRVQSTPQIYTANNYHPVLAPSAAINDQQLWTDFWTGDAVDPSTFVTVPFPLLSHTEVQTVDEAFASVVADVGANAFVSDLGAAGFYLDDYDQERISDVLSGTSRDPFNKDWVQPVLPTSGRLTGFYRDLAHIPAAFADAHGITDEADVIEAYRFGDILVRNNAGYSALEIYLAYAAGDLTDR